MMYPRQMSNLTISTVTNWRLVLEKDAQLSFHDRLSSRFRPTAELLIRARRRRAPPAILRDLMGDSRRADDTGCSRLRPKSAGREVSSGTRSLPSSRRLEPY